VIWVTGGHITFDNIEIVGQFIKGGHSGPSSGYDCGIYFSGSSGNVVENGFFHDWVSDAANINLGFSNCAGGIGQNGGSYTAINMTISDQFGRPVPIGGCFQNATEVSGSHCSYVAQGALGFGSVHDTEFDHLTNAGTIAPYTNGIHSNVIEQTFPGGGGVVFNNLIHDNVIGVVILVCSNTPVYNNVIWKGNVPLVSIDTNTSNCSSNSIPANVYNNTVDCSNGVSCFRVVDRGLTLSTLNLNNNHWITNGSPVCINNRTAGCSSVTAANVSSNVTMSLSTASSQGYSSANQYRPTSSSAGTVHAALNLSSLCIGNFSAFCSDRLHVKRSASWDAGAYLFDGQSSSAPTPPTNLNAVVQ
jgi:hypothetical protein